VLGVWASGSGESWVHRIGSVGAGAALLTLAARHVALHDRRRWWALVGMGTAFVAAAASPLAVAVGAVSALVLGRTAFANRSSVRARPIVFAIISAVIACGGVVWWVRQQTDLVWYWFPDESDLRADLVVVALFMASLANAVFEESLWRWLLPAFLRPGGNFMLAIGFGVAHWNSIPGGVTGMILTAAFGFGMHALVRFSGNTIALAVLVHAGADFTLLWHLFGAK
jgi:hypothetical protein